MDKVFSEAGDPSCGQMGQCGVGSLQNGVSNTSVNLDPGHDKTETLAGFGGGASPKLHEILDLSKSLQVIQVKESSPTQIVGPKDDLSPCT